MNDLRAAKRRWSFVQSDLPTVLVASGPSTWAGFEFQEVQTQFHGAFECKPTPLLSVMYVLGPLRVRFGGARKPFQNVPTHPTLGLPRDESHGAWEGATRGRHLFIEPDAFERTTHQPFRPWALRLFDGPNPAVERLLCALQMDASAGHPVGPTLGEQIISSILHQIVLQSGVVLGGPTWRAPSLSRSELGRVFELIEAELVSSLTLEKLAASIDFSVRHLCRSFRQSTGVSLHQYIVLRRIERAKMLINRSQLSLEEIAEAVGFAHHAHMSATFRRLTGQTPKQFRARPTERSELDSGPSNAKPALES